MSEQASSLQVSGSQALPQPTPHRPVVALALVLFIPELWLVMHGNLAVQTALVRFIGVLLVSWGAARLVIATVGSFTRSGAIPGAAGAPGLDDAASPAGKAGPGGADLAGQPHDTDSISASTPVT